MIEISLAIREACGRSGIRSDGQPPHKGEFIEKRRKPSRKLIGNGVDGIRAGIDPARRIFCSARPAGPLTALCACKPL